MSGISHNLPGGNIQNLPDRVRFLGPLIKEVAHRIMSAIEASKANHEDISKLRKSIIEAGRLGNEIALFNGQTFAKTSLEDLQSLGSDEGYWRYKVSMAIRVEMLDVRGRNSIKTIFEEIVSDLKTKDIFKEESGYNLASHLYTKGNMLMAHNEMSRILKAQGTNLKAELNWLAITGSTRD